jgi:glutamate-1-semialdehyde 2,1-aminomutase
MNLPHHFVIANFNDIQATRAVLDSNVAAILVEPMQSAGGGHVASEDFLRFLRKAADEFNAILIFDEVVTSRLDYRGLQVRHTKTSTIVGEANCGKRE